MLQESDEGAISALVDVTLASNPVQVAQYRRGKQAVAGFLVGEYLLLPLRERIRAKPGTLDWSDKALLFMIDPLGVMSAETVTSCLG